MPQGPVLRLVLADRPQPDGPRREVAIWRDGQGLEYARAYASDTASWIAWKNLATFAFSDTADVRAWPEPDVPANRVADVFARVVQPIVLQAMGCQALHAGAVAGDNGVLAFCGVGHSGKSTVAYALGQRGYRQIADDALVLRVSEGRIAVRPLPFAPSLRPASRFHFDKSAVDSDHVHQPNPVDDGLPLKAVFILRQDAALTAPAGPDRLSPVQAFSALLTHAHCFDETSSVHTRRLAEDYLTIAGQVPVMTLTYPPRFAQIEWLLRLVERAAEAAGLRSLVPPLVTADHALPQR